MDGAIEISMMPRCGLEASSTSYTTGEGSIRDWIIFRRSSSKRKSKRELSNLQRQNRWCHRSSPLANVAYKRSRCENFWGGSWRISTKKEKRTKKERKVRKGRPVETDTAVEIRTRWPSATSYWWISTAA